MNNRLENDIYCAIRRGDEEVDQLRSHLRKINKNVERETKRPINPIVVAIAASMVVIVTISATMFYFSNSVPTPERLYQTYYKPFVVPTATRSNQDPGAFERAMFLYAQNDFSSSISALAPVMKNSPEAAYFVTGLCYLQMGLADMAIKNFNQAEESSFYYKEHIWWYKALTYVRKNEPQIAGVILQKLVRNNGLYRTEAADLLRKIS